MLNLSSFHRPIASLFVVAFVAYGRSASADAPSAPAHVPASDAAVDVKAVEAEIIGAITVVSPTQRTITPRGAELVRAHGPDLIATFRHIFERHGGVAVGVRLFGIRPDSLAHKLGLENGDRVEALLGKPLDTPEHVAAAFEALKGATTIDLTLSRRGAPLKIVTTVK